MGPPALIGAAAAELKGLTHLTLTLSPMEALAMVAALRLAGRHPGNTGLLAQLGKDVADGMARHLCQGDRPALRLLCETAGEELASRAFPTQGR
jgi:hypothetical protein